MATSVFLDRANKPHITLVHSVRTGQPWRVVLREHVLLYDRQARVDCGVWRSYLKHLASRFPEDEFAPMWAQWVRENFA